MDFHSTIECLAKEEIVVIDDFLNPSALRNESESRFHSGTFRSAGIGKLKSDRSDMRRDQIDWWETESLSPAQTELTQKLDLLRMSLNRELFLGLVDWEGHYARYAPGDFYQKHLDRFQNDDRRVLSTVFYLNESWAEKDQGALWVFPPKGAPRAILPEAGRLVLFLSDRIPHEVKPSARERWSVAGWFRRRALR